MRFSTTTETTSWSITNAPIPDSACSSNSQKCDHGTAVQLSQGDNNETCDGLAYGQTSLNYAELQVETLDSGRKIPATSLWQLETGPNRAQQNACAQNTSSVTISFSQKLLTPKLWCTSSKNVQSSSCKVQEMLLLCMRGIQALFVGKGSEATLFFAPCV